MNEKEKDEGLVCPACGSNNIAKSLDVLKRWRCLDCGFEWDEYIYDSRHFGFKSDYSNEDNYPDSEDGWTEEEEFWFE